MAGSVLVVGAGPVGLAAACELARRDVPVRIIDTLAAPTDESRAAVVHARTLEAFARMGVVDEVIATGQRTTGMVMYADKEPIGRFALDTVAGPFPFTVSLPQDETERILAERLAALGVTVERGSELVSLEQDAGGVRARLRDGDTIESDWLVGADGAHGAVRGQLNLRLEGSFKGERFLLGDVDADHGLDAASMHSFFSRDDGPLLAFPMVGRRLRLIGQIEGEVEPTLAAMQALVDERTTGFPLESARWLTVFEIHHAQVPRYRVGRVFLAGDAAHVHSPAGGQGMNTGIQDAFNLGWKLAQACAGSASEELLDSYHDERHPVAAHVIAMTTAMTHAGTVRHSLGRRLRDRGMQRLSGLAPVAHAMAEETEETRVAYHDSPIVAGHRFGDGGPRPGDIAPPGFADGDGHAVLTVGRAARREGAAAVEDPEDRFGFGHPGGIAVVRPDGYIGLLAAAHDDAALAAYFARIQGRPRG